MKHVVKSVLLWYSPREMFDLVTAVQDYPRFLPWCESADVLQDHGDGVTARLGLHYMGVRHAFTTRNHNVPGERVSIELVDGPFSLLDVASDAAVWRRHPNLPAVALSGRSAGRARLGLFGRERPCNASTLTPSSAAIPSR